MKFSDIIERNNNNLAYNNYSEKTIIISLKPYNFFKLTDVGSLVWKLIESKITIKKLINKIARIYKINKKEIGQDIFELLYDLYNNYLICVNDKEKTLDSDFSFLNTVESNGKVNDIELELDEMAQDALIPIIVELELTHRCNLNCRFCYLDRSELNSELELREIILILDQLYQEGGLFLALTGGECMLRKDFLEIVRFAKNKHFEITILTNGTMITKNIAEEINKLNVKEVKLSIHGSTENENDEFTRSKGSFKKTIKAAMYLKDVGVNTCFVFNLTKLNINNYEKMIKLSTDLGIKYQINAFLYPMINRTQNIDKYRIEAYELQKLFKSNVLEFNKHKCNGLQNRVRINPDGQLHACALLREKIGRLPTQNFQQLWYSTKANKLREAILNDAADCLQCADYKKCNRCPAISLIEEGSLNKPSRLACFWTYNYKMAKKKHMSLKKSPKGGDKNVFKTKTENWETQKG